MTQSDKSLTFPFAPEQWSIEDVYSLAEQEGLAISREHQEVLSALQEYYTKHDFGRFSVRELHDALDEKFHARGGYKYLYRLFPAGPIAQGCRLAGLEPPAGAVDKGFGSVV